MELSCIHIAVDVVKEHQVDKCKVFSTKLNRSPCSQKQEHKELHEVLICKVEVIEVARIWPWEKQLRPKEVTRCLHEVEEKECGK